MENKKLTNEVGAPVSENEHSLTSGPRGPVALQDVWLLEKLAHFDREVIPERRMHAKGWGAYGTLDVYKRQDPDGFVVEFGGSQFVG